MVRKGVRAAIVIAAFVTCTSLAAQGVHTGDLQNYCPGMDITASTHPSDKYGPPKAVDGSLSTHWASDKDARPPQWIEVTFQQPRRIDTLALLPVKHTNLYANASDIRVSFSSGDPISATLEDKSSAHVIRFPARETESLRITILSSYGEKYYLGFAEVMAFFDPDRTVEPIISPVEKWRKPDLTAHGRDEHPCLYKTRADVRRALENIEKHQWAAEYVENMREQADEWLQRSDEWLLAQIPEPGAAFAEGFSGCPICGASWGRRTNANCSFDNPGHVRCANGHVLPDEDHPDDGTGWEGPNGQMYYFVGSYNSWVIEKLQFEALRPLCLTYLLTGDERYGHKAAVIMDGIAAIYPGCDKGPWDWPSGPTGRLARPKYQTARVLIHYADWYDEIFHCPALDEPSVVEGMTRRENVEENLLKDGGWYCYEHTLSASLNNGHADYLRGALAVGCVLGIHTYVRWAHEGLYGIQTMVANNIDRDGRYFETSLGYALHTRDLYLTFSEPLLNYRSEAYPEGINLYDDPKFASFYFLPGALFDCAGHTPSYGDRGPDTGTAYPSHPILSKLDYMFAEQLYARTSGELREQFGAALAYLGGERGEDIRAALGDPRWLMFHAEPFPEPEANEADVIRQRLSSSDFFGQKGIAILRAGEGEEAEAALLRYGPSLNHGQHDELNLNYYALGKEVTYDLGYGLASTHTNCGWTRQTASHNLVVVDETSQHVENSGTGGSLHIFAEMPGIRVMEADAPAAYAGQDVQQYRRLIAMVGDGTDRYLVDVFRVSGGSQHDYMLHTVSDALDIEGVELGEVEEGSLAGPDISWGKQLGLRGYIEQFPNRHWWNPPPGNGYGFLVDVRRGQNQPTDPWSATWEIDPSRDANLRLLNLPEEGTDVITATGPGLYAQHPEAAYVCARRTGEGLHSEFASVLEPYSADNLGHTIRARQMMQRARISSGTMKPVVGDTVLLYKADKAGDRMTFPMTVPEEDNYTLTVGHYKSYAYGTARLLVDGEPVGKPFEGNAAMVEPAEPKELGEVHLAAGEHEITLELTAPDDEGNYWMGLSFVALKPSRSSDTAQPARPRIDAAQRLSVDRPGGVGLQIRGRDAVTDYVFSAPDVIRRTYENRFTVAAPFARLRTDSDGNPLRVNLIGGALNSDRLRMSLEQPSWQGRVIEVNEAEREVVVDTVLPDDGRLIGSAVYFNNPDYSRNTAYHIESISTTDSHSRIRVREASFILGKARTYSRPPDEHTLTSYVPHEYAKPRGGTGPAEVDFFRGKRIRSADGAVEAAVLDVNHGNPTEIVVDSSDGFEANQELLYSDIQPGDRMVIYSLGSLTRLGDGRYRLESNSAVRLVLKTEAAIEYRLGDGEWQSATGNLMPASTPTGGPIEVRLAQ